MQLLFTKITIQKLANGLTTGRSSHLDYSADKKGKEPKLGKQNNPDHWVSWYMPSMPALVKQSQADPYEFEASSVYKQKVIH